MKIRWQTIAIWIVCMAAGYGIIYAGEMTGVVDTFIENMLVMMGINIILAVSLNLIVGFSGQFSLGHAGFMAIGAYATGIMTQTESTFAGLIFSMVTGIALAIVIALIVGVPTLRLKGDYLAIATMGAAEIIRLTANNLKITNGPAGLYNIPQLANWPIVYIMMCLTIIIVANFVHSKTGRAIRAVRNDELAATAMGINATKYKLMAFVMGRIIGSSWRFALRFISAEHCPQQLQHHGVGFDLDHRRIRRDRQHYWICNCRHRLRRDRYDSAKLRLAADGDLRGHADRYYDCQAKRTDGAARVFDRQMAD